MRAQTSSKDEAFWIFEIPKTVIWGQLYASRLPIPDDFWVMWEGPPYRRHSLGNGSKWRRRKGLNTVCIAPTNTSVYVNAATPLVLKRWVWPMIQCSHLTPKSLYSYIDDLVIANCLIDAIIRCACFFTYFICHFIVWTCRLHILLIRGQPLVVWNVWSLFLWPSGWTRMPKYLL